MTIAPIKTARDYDRALGRIDQLMEAKPGTKAGDELDVLTTLVEVYEARHHPIYPPDPIDAIIFRMDQLGLTRKDLEAVLGGRGRVKKIGVRVQLRGESRAKDARVWPQSSSAFPWQL
jgi:HTH-type transcriptional regulator/antitoxin HigA